MAVQYFTCDVSLFEDASNLLEAMHEQQKSAFMRPEMSQCLLDPWFIEYFPNFVSEEAKAQNKTVKPSKDFLRKFANKFSPLRPLVDPQVMSLFGDFQPFFFFCLIAFRDRDAMPLLSKRKLLIVTN